MSDSTQNLERRIGSVNNIKQITKAMEMVAATKMRRSQEIALNSRPYAITAIELLANLSAVADPELVENLPLLEQIKVKKTAVVIITSDKGLAGAFNSNVLRKTDNFIKEEGDLARKDRYVFIAVGQKTSLYLSKKKVQVAAEFMRVGDFTAPDETKPIADLLVQGFQNHSWDEVITFGTHFRTALRQEVLRRRIFPVDFGALHKAADEILPERGRFSEFHKSPNIEHPTSNIQHSDYLIEPSPAQALNSLVPHLIAMQVYHLVLEANASEHAARRTAMKSATDNAEELSSELRLQYNKSRQSAITTEIAEITSGVEATKN